MLEYLYEATGFHHALVGGAVAAWPLVARAQQPGKPPAIGILGTGSPSTWVTWLAAFALPLRQLGWIEERTVAIEYRWAQGRRERYAEIAAKFVRLPFPGCRLPNHGTAPQHDDS